jgi:short-subunit dehydrogenase
MVALVTGASSGIGLAFAHVLAEHSYDLVLVARKEVSLGPVISELEEKHGVHASMIICDLSDPAAAQRLHAEVQRRGIRIDILINNAGFNRYGPFADTELSTDMDMIQVNLITLVMLTKFFLRDMISRRTGRILNIGSTSGFGPAPYVNIYAATKAFVLSFSEGLFEEVKGTGVAVGVLCPGSTHTEFAARAGMLDTKVFSGKLMKASEVADIGYAAMMRGRMTTITGFANKFQVWSCGLLPDR